MRALTFVLLAAMTIPIAHAADSGEYWAYSGTYTGPSSQGIYGFTFRPSDGTLTPVGLMAATPNPSFLAIDPQGKYLYTVNEEDDGKLTAFSIDKTSGKLTQLQTVTTRGGGPCHLSFDRTGKFIFAANYNTGSLIVYPIQPDGRFGESTGFIQFHGSSINKERQEGPHAHYVTTSPDNRFVLVADLGLDHVAVLKFDAQKGTIEPNDPPFWKGRPGAGPRHLAFAPGGKHVFLLNEIDSTVTSLAFDARTGRLKDLQTLSALPADFHGESSAAEIQVSASGKFLYSSNRGNDTIAVFSVHGGDLKLIQNASTLGKEPRHFTLDPSGAFLLTENQNSSNIMIFHVDPKAGMLRPTGKSVPTPTPVCLVFLKK